MVDLWTRLGVGERMVTCDGMSRRTGSFEVVSTQRSNWRPGLLGETETETETLLPPPSLMEPAAPMVLQRR
jgi:hypothetical protein